MLERLTQLRQEAEGALQGVQDADALERFRVTYLGSKGKLKGAMAWLKEADPAQRRELGQGLNQLKTQLQQAFEGKASEHRSAAPANVGSNAVNPAYLPKTSKTIIRSWDPAAVRMSFVKLIVRVTQVLKPIHKSVPGTSLSIVFGIATTWNPF